MAKKSNEEKLHEKEEKKKIKKEKADEKKKVKELKKKEKKIKPSKVKESSNNKNEETKEIKPRIEKEKKSIFNIILKFILLITIVASGFAIFSLTLLDSIENTLRYVAIGVIAFIDLILILRVFIKSKKKKHK